MGSSASKPADDPKVKARIEELIKENPVMAFTKITCPYCASAKMLLKKKGIQYHYVDVDRACKFFPLMHVTSISPGLTACNSWRIRSSSDAEVHDGPTDGAVYLHKWTADRW